MSTVIIPEISKRNKYYIDKHRYYELKHFCLQYYMFKSEYKDLDESILQSKKFGMVTNDTVISDKIFRIVVKKLEYLDKIEMIEMVAYDADEYIAEYILRAVTEDLPYTYLKTKLNIPCSRDYYYDRYRKFFWLLDKSRK